MNEIAHAIGVLGVRRCVLDRLFLAALATKSVGKLRGLLSPIRRGRKHENMTLAEEKVQIPVHRGQSFRGIADSIPVIADSF